jgi:hypothetical protein
MAKDYTSLLGKSSGASWGDIAGAYLSKGKKKDKKARNVLLATLFFNAKEAQMQSRVLKNLEENNRQETFNQAAVTNRWNAYNTLMDDDAEFKKNPNYFRLKAEAKFNELNPNYDERYKQQGITPSSAYKTKEREILEYEEALKNLHIEKIKTGNVGKRLTKEEFFKPFEDYYVSQREKITAPQNVSLVHKGWNFLTGGKKKELTEQEKINRLNVATRGSFGYLLNPDEIKGEGAIALYRDPNAFTFNAQEAKASIAFTIEDADLRRKILSTIKEGDTYTPNQLRSKVVVESQDFDPLMAKIETAGRQFDILWKKETGGIPEEGADRISYALRRANWIDERAGIGDRDTIELRKKLFELEDLKKEGVTEQERPLVRALEAAIRNAGIDKLTLTLFNTITAETRDPLMQKIIEDEYGEGKDNSRRYITDKLNESLMLFESIFED